MEVVQLQKDQKTKSKYDLFVQGDMLKFHIEYSGHGAHVCWYKEVKTIDTMPKQIRHLIVDDGAVQKISVVGKHIELSTFEKLVGITLEHKIRKWVSKTHKDLQNIHKEFNELENIKKRIEET